MLVLFGGPAGAGKSTLARAWCATRDRAVHIELDEVRHLIVAGRADPQRPDTTQAEQYGLSAAACVGLARPFLAAGYDVAIDDVFDPTAVERYWQPHLPCLTPYLAVVLPSLEETLRRSRSRAKRVFEHHTRDQHAACLTWPAHHRLDTTSLTVEQSMATLAAMLRDERLRLPLHPPKTATGPHTW